MPLKATVKVLLSVWLMGFVLLAVTPDVHSQDPTHQRIESDDPLVVQDGEWISQNASGVSGENYLYNAQPQIEAALILSFSGTSLQVIYVSGPGLGTLAIEVDGTVLRTVITTADKTSYGQAAKIDYLSDESHTLKVYAQAGGMVGVDAFVIASPPTQSAQADVQSNSDPRLACDPPDRIHEVSIPSGLTPDPYGWSRILGYHSISADGRYVVFASLEQLVPEDTNDLMDAFVRDRYTCTTIRVSVASDGSQMDRPGPSVYEQGITGVNISTNGRYVVFSSDAPDLVAGDIATCGGNISPGMCGDVFVHDMQTGQTILVSLADDEQQGNQNSSGGLITDDGRYVFFSSYATNLTANPNPNTVYMRDLQNNTTTAISLVPPNPPQVTDIEYSYADISPDGRYILVMQSSGTYGHLNYPILYDRLLNAWTPISGQSLYQRAALNITPDGRYMLFISRGPDILPGTSICGGAYCFQLYRYDFQTSTVVRVSVASDGSTVGNDATLYGTLSQNGRYVAFDSLARNLVANDTNNTSDVFVRDMETGVTHRVSVAADGTQANNSSTYPSISADGRYVAFESNAINLVPSSVPTTPHPDIYVTQGAVPSPTPLALFNSATHVANLIGTLNNPPVASDYVYYTTGFPQGAGGQYVMGDWNGDGFDTMGVYRNGAFWYTNDYGQTGNWTGIWIGLMGRPAVAGRFAANVANDCIGVVDSAEFPPYGTAFALYFSCNLTSGSTPPLTFQWLSVVLPTSQGHSGTHQFGAGDLDGDGVDSLAIRRGNYVAWTNVPPTTLLSEFSLAQYFGAPGTGDEGKFVVGDWDLNNVDSFGLVYQNGRFYRRDDLQWNSGAYTVQQFTPLVGTPFSVTTWQPS